jgi:Na+/glutamate symporter
MKRGSSTTLGMTNFRELGMTALWVLGMTVAAFGMVTIVTIGGCAEKRLEAPRPGEPFWRSCEEAVQARSKGEQRFVCVDVKGRRWDVVVRRAGK